MTVKNFSTFCPKAIAGIGRLLDTVSDRSIPIRMERKPVSQNLAELRNALWSGLPSRSGIGLRCGCRGRAQTCWRLCLSNRPVCPTANAMQSNPCLR